MKTNNKFKASKVNKNLVYTIRGPKLSDDKIYVLKQKETKTGFLGLFKKTIKQTVTEMFSTKPNYKNNIWNHKGLF
jgi:hypothetical protein